MKRFFCFLLTVVCAATLAACSTQSSRSDVADPTSAADSAQIPNPWQEYDTLDALNAAVGTSLTAPKDLSVSEEHFSAMEGEAYTLAEYRFTYNGAVYTLRTAPTQEDISGLWMAGKTVGDTNEDFATVDGSPWTRWYDESGQRQFSLYGKNASAEDFAAVTATLAQ
ncbi:hypothetical protein [uncultured Gemmiger sp.]|uniref:hypothetical protein n=1 Tax=uncultured Gemmiger sp. TaxID=1623490 RepID=UPI0025FCF520|nr:hypothetical protein [uncultured Gemmiger sp.]